MCQKDEGMKKKGGHAETVSFKQFFFCRHNCWITGGCRILQYVKADTLEKGATGKTRAPLGAWKRNFSDFRKL